MNYGGKDGVFVKCIGFYINIIVIYTAEGGI